MSEIIGGRLGGSFAKIVNYLDWFNIRILLKKVKIFNCLITITSITVQRHPLLRGKILA